MISLRTAALGPLLEADASAKAQATLALDSSLPVDADVAIPASPGIPGRPPKPELVPHSQLEQKSVALLEGRAQSPEISSVIHPDAAAKATSPDQSPLMAAVKKLTAKD